MSRQEILTCLKESGGYVSGEELSRRLCLSRAAVWKAVDGLRKAGYTIEARTGLGYRLTETPDALTEREIGDRLGPRGLVGCRLDCLETVDSTNTYAKRIALEGAADGTVVVADCQTGGRGRLGRGFLSPTGKGVYLTALLRPPLPPVSLLPVTALCAVAVCDAVEEVCGLRPGVKWTNDLVLGSKKLCGILTELSLEGETGRLQYLVIGAGVNVHHTREDFTADVADMATSLDMETGRSISRPALAAAEIRALDRLYRALLSGDLTDWLRAYRRDCVTLGRTVQIISPQGGREVVEALDVDDQFGLVVRRPDNSIDVIRSGEVSVRGLYGYVE